jgi:hypothetical protein
LVAAATTAGFERPFTVEDVGNEHRDHARNDLRGDRLGVENRQLKGVKDARVDDERGTADDRELDQLVVLDEQISQRLGDAVYRVVDY